MPFTLAPIGYIQSPYKEKFGIPRQPDLAPSAPVSLILVPPYNQAETVRGLENFSHLWVQFIFHQTQNQGWRPLIRPPRLGGNKKVGVFASRSTHRPNALGLSLVRIRQIETHNGVTIHLEGADLLDGTPVLDIKPYIGFVESKPNAKSGFVDGPPPTLEVIWAKPITELLANIKNPPPYFKNLVEEVIAQDPRPAYQDDPTRIYGMHLDSFNIRFQIAAGVATILEIHPA